MKKATEVKYPNSASLFQFCRRVLDHKFGGIRVIDQDVGQILGFDPADCSHWKKGKKNIRSIQAMKSIAEHLGVDERLVVDVAAGELDESEAFHEFSGYGAFDIDSKLLESAKKEYYRRNAATWSKDREQEFRALFSPNEGVIEEVVSAIHRKINFIEAPLYLPEISAAYPEIKLTPINPAQDAKTTTTATPNEVVNIVVTHKGETGPNGEPITTSEINYAMGTEMRPFVRYRIAKLMAQHFLAHVAPTPAEFGDFANHLQDVQGNIFAAKLLAPPALIRREMLQLNVAKDIVAQLAEVFWVSKTFMNRRLKDILQHGPAL